MTIEGHVERGQIILDQDVPLPEGMRVRIELLDDSPTKKAGQEEPPGELPSLFERMKPFVGSVTGLPPDYAINHDHFLHGQPKRQ